MLILATRRTAAVRGYYSARTWSLDSAAFSTPNVGFRPVLEILNPDALGSDGLKVVTLDLERRQAGRQLRCYSHHREKRQQVYRACIQRPDPSGRKYRQLLHVARKQR